MRRKLFVVGCAALLATGCQSKPVNAFHSWETPTQTATVVEDNGVYCQIVNAFLIGEDPETELFHSKASHTYTIPAGPTKLMVGYEVPRNPGGGGSALSVTFTKPQRGISKEVAFVAEIGHTYSFEAKTPLIRFFGTEYANDEWDVRVLDKSDKRVIAETRDRDKATTKPAAVAQASPAK